MASKTVWRKSKRPGIAVPTENRKTFRESVWYPVIVATISSAVGASLAAYSAYLLETHKANLAAGAERAKRDSDTELARRATIQSAIVKYATVIGEQLSAESDYLAVLADTGYDKRDDILFEKRMAAVRQDENSAEIALAVLDGRALVRIHVLKDEVTTAYSWLGYAKRIFNDHSMKPKETFSDLYQKVFWSRALMNGRLSNVANGKDADVDLSEKQRGQVNYQGYKNGLMITPASSLKNGGVPIYPFKSGNEQ